LVAQIDKTLVSPQGHNMNARVCEQSIQLIHAFAHYSVVEGSMLIEERMNLSWS